jgi:predicted outer membrane protein
MGKPARIRTIARRICALVAASVALTAFVCAPASAQAPPVATPRADDASLASLENSAAFVGGAFPDIHFLNETSRMAISHAGNEKTRAFALTVAKEETSAGISIMNWMRGSGGGGTIVPSATPAFTSLAVSLKTPRMVPSQAAALQHLSRLQGQDFDVFYASVEKEALLRLESVCQDFVQNGADPGLRAIAAQELPEVKRMIVALGAL